MLCVQFLAGSVSHRTGSFLIDRLCDFLMPVLDGFDWYATFFSCSLLPFFSPAGI